MAIEEKWNNSNSIRNTASIDSQYNNLKSHHDARNNNNSHNNYPFPSVLVDEEHLTRMINSREQAELLLLSEIESTKSEILIATSSLQYLWHLANLGLLEALRRAHNKGVSTLVLYPDIALLEESNSNHVVASKMPNDDSSSNSSSSNHNKKGNTRSSDGNTTNQRREENQEDSKQG